MLSPDGRAPGARDVLAAILRYILETSRAELAPLRAQLARQVGPKKAEEMLTTAEKLRREGEARGEARGKAEGKREGKAEGKREGKAEGKRETLLLLLRQRFGRVPAAAAERIGSAGIEQLDAWSSQVLRASSLDELLGTKVAVPSEAARPTRARPGAARRRAPG